MLLLMIVRFSWRRHYYIYDVYNPNFLRGGRFTMAFMGVWSADRMGRWPQLKNSKFDRRRDFGGITLKTVNTVISYFDFDSI